MMKVELLTKISLTNVVITGFTGGVKPFTSFAYKSNTIRTMSY